MINTWPLHLNTGTADRERILKDDLGSQINKRLSAQRLSAQRGYRKLVTHFGTFTFDLPEYGVTISEEDETEALLSAISAYISDKADAIFFQRIEEWVRDFVRGFGDNGHLELNEWFYSFEEDEFEIEWQRNGVVLGLVVDRQVNDCSYYFLVHGKTKGADTISEVFREATISYIVGLARVAAMQ